MINLINNTNGKDNHLSLLKELLPKASEIFISVAFFKDSGFKFIKPYLDQGKNATIMAGANFGITDPAALESLMEYEDNCKVYLSKLSSKVIFHPKMYLLRSKGSCHIIIGSANLTNGGMQANNECSIYYRCGIEDQMWKDALIYFKQCLSVDNADYLTFPVLDAYIKYHKKQQLIITKSDPFPDVSDNLFYDLKNLKKHYNQLDQKVIQRQLKEKKERYDKAKIILDEIAGGQLTDARFSQQFKKLVINQNGDEPKLWSSNGMARQVNRVLSAKKLFRKLVLAVKNNLGQNPEVIYSYAKEVSDQIKGTGANYIGEIMLTYQYKRLPNLNNNPVTVLRKEACARINAYPNNYKEQDYVLYYRYISQIAKELGLKDMLEVDYFFDKTYQKIKHQLAVGQPSQNKSGFQKSLKKVSYSNFQHDASLLKVFSSPDGTIYNNSGTDGDQLIFSRPGKSNNEVLNLIDVYEAYQQIDDYTTEAFKLYVNGKQSPARALLFELELIEHI
ncbi:MAG: hypothetical protein EOO42_00620 [Flavobacteriales bacterium]|nr:MAG: hypothetical protein EOO42_00620 [Flavobacteriales bacterium]